MDEDMWRGMGLRRVKDTKHSVEWLIMSVRGEVSDNRKYSGVVQEHEEANILGASKVTLRRDKKRMQCPQ